MANKRESNGIWDWQVTRTFVALSLFLFGWKIFQFGYTEEGIRECIRWSARISVVLFCLSFGASSLPYFLKNSLSFWVNMNRKYIGVSFAIIHIIHLSFLIILQQFFHPVFSLANFTSLLAGGLAYLFIFMMLLTSFNTFSKFLSNKSWKLLHTIGGYWIWAVFMSSYWKRVINFDFSYLPIAVLLILVVLLKLGKLKVIKAI